jgi:hypothetical protein
MLWQVAFNGRTWFLLRRIVAVKRTGEHIVEVSPQLPAALVGTLRSAIGIGHIDSARLGRPLRASASFGETRDICQYS